jgi:hypothetical protein
VAALWVFTGLHIHPQQVQRLAALVLVAHLMVPMAAVPLVPLLQLHRAPACSRL